MAIPPILIELKAMTSEFKASMTESKAEMAELEETGSKHMSGLQSAAKTAAVGIGVGFVAAAGMSIKAGIDYQSTMATIQGSADLTAGQVKKIGDSFTDTMGKSTFSAQEIASSLAPVAGVVKQISGGTLTAGSSLQFMKAAMDESEATGVKLASTTKDLSAVMLTYGLGVKDAGEASNTLFNVSQATGVGLDTLTATVDKLRTKLGAASPSLTDTGTLMVDLAEHGVAGSKGVMAVSSGLTTLLGSSKSTSAEVKALGLNLYDSSGKFVGMQAVIAQLQPKLVGMSDQQRNVAESALFGKSAAATLNGTLLAGVGAWDKASAAVEKKDAVDKAAEAQSKTLHGQIEKVAATAEDLAVKFGQILIPIIQKAIGVITNIVGWLTKHATIAKVLGIAILGIVTALGVYNLAVKAAEIATAAFDAVMDANPIVLVVVAIAALAVGLVEAYKHCGPFRDIVNAIGSALKVVWDDVLKPVVDFFENHWKAALEIAVAVFAPFIALPLLVVAKWRAIASFFVGLWNEVVGAFEAGFNAVKNVVMGVIDAVIGFVTDHWKLIVDIILGPFGLILTNIGTIWDAITGVVSTAINAIESVISTVMNAIESVISTVMAAITATWNAVWDGIKAAATAVWDAIVTFVTVQIDAVKTVITAVTTAISTAWTAVWTAMKTVATALWDAIKTVVTVQIDAVKAVITTVVNDIKSAWSTAWNAVKSAVTTVWDGIKSAISTAINGVETIFTGLVTFVKGLPGKIEAAAAGMWDGVKNAFRAAINWIIDAWDSLHFTIHIPSVNLGFMHIGGGDISFGVPHIPEIATGGMTTGKMLAVVGDNPSGAEVVLPMDSQKTINTLSLAMLQASRLSQSSGPAPALSSTFGGTTGHTGAPSLTVMQPITVTVTGSDAANPHAIATLVKQEIASNNADLVRRITAAGGRR